MATRELKVEIVGDSKSLERALGKASGASSKFGSTFAKVGKVAALGLVAVGAGAAVAGKKMIEMASDAAEVDSKLDVVFGKALPAMAKNLDKFSEATGASRFQLREQAADMGALLEPLTATKKGAADMSTQFVKLATDLGSFNNVPVDEALLAIRSGLVGEAEPLRRFGVLLNAAAVEAEGLRLGLVKQGAEMSEQAKVQARASLIMQQTTLAQGDATRTAGSMSNQMKALRNNITDAATSLGTKLIPFALAAVKSFNDNWPQIEKVVQQVMDLLIRGTEAAVAAVRRNFDMIKNVIRVTFETSLAVIRKVADFFRTDFGQTVGVGLASILALRGAMNLLGISVGGVGKALTLLKANPMWAILIPLGFALGAVVEQFIKGQIEAQKLDSALRQAGGGADSLKAALDRLKQGHLQVDQAQINLERSTTRVKDAQAAVNKIFAAGKGDTDAGRAAVLDLRQALADYEQATIDLKGAQEGLGKSQRDRNQELLQGKAALFALSDAGQVNIKSAQALSSATEEFTGKARTLQSQASATAASLEKTDPAASRAKAKVAFLADAAADLAEKLGRVPKREEIIAEAKARNFPQFYAELLKIAQRLADAKATALAGGDAIGAALGTGMLQGIIRTKVAAVTAAASAVLEAISAMQGAAGAKSPSTKTAQLGKDLADGLLLGYLNGTATLPEKMSEKLRTSIERMATVIQGQKTRLSTAFGQLATDALAAFDGATDAGLDRIQAKLDRKLAQIGARLSAALKKIDVAQGVLTPAEKALAKLDRSETVRGLQEGLAAAEKAVAEAADPEALVAANEQLRQAQLAIYRDQLEQQATAERAKADAKAEADRIKAQKQADRDTLDAQRQGSRELLNYQSQRDRLRRHMERFLEIQQEYLDKHPGQWRAVHNRIMKAFKDEFGPDLRTAGKNLGTGFAAGLVESFGAVGGAADDLARLIAKYLKVKSPTELGPMSDLDAWWTNLTTTLVSGIDPKPVEAAGISIAKKLFGGVETGAKTLAGSALWDKIGGAGAGADTGAGSDLSQPTKDLGDFTIVVQTVSAAVQALRDNMAALKVEGIQHFKLLKEGLDIYVPPAVAILQTLLDKLNQIREMYLGIAGAADKAGDVTGVDLSSLIGLQKGGVVTKPTLALIGEAGPEAVVPLGKSYGAMPGGGLVINNYISGSVTSERDLVTSIRNAIVAEGRRSGGNLMGGYA